jgi:hypothetical protein
MRRGWKEFAKQFYKYGAGDKKSGNIWRMKKNLMFVFGFWMYVISLSLLFFISFRFAIIFLILPIFYFLFEGIKVAMESGKLIGIFYGFLLNLIKRIAYVMGVSLGR